MKLTDKQRKRLADIVEKLGEAIFISVPIGYLLSPETVSAHLAIAGMIVAGVLLIASLQIEK